MKTIQKLFLSVLILSIATTSFAQGIFIKGGANFANMFGQDDNGTFSDDFDILTGFNASFGGEIPLSEIFNLETAIGVSTKGFSFEESLSILGEEITTKSSLNLLYVDIPISFKVMFGSDNFKAYAAAGPYVGIGVMGKTTSEVTTLGKTEASEADIVWGNDPAEDDIKRLDYGGRVAAGLVVNSILLELAYQHGLANISPDDSNGNKLNHRVLSLSAGFRIGR